MKNKLSSFKQIDFYSRVLNSFIKQGKKSPVKKSFDECFFTLSKKFRKPLYLILKTIFLLLNNFVETKTLRIKRGRHIVPFPTVMNRRIYLVIKWLTIALKSKKRKSSFANSLKNELFNLFLNKRRSSSKIMKLKQENILRSLSNRSNVHYRW